VALPTPSRSASSLDHQCVRPSNVRRRLQRLGQGLAVIDCSWPARSCRISKAGQAGALMGAVASRFQRDGACQSSLQPQRAADLHVCR
jgi:hypothetical protein